MAVKAYDWIAHFAKQIPDHLAQIDLYSKRRYTYKAMDERTAKLAGAFKNLGVERGDRVALLANNTTDCLDAEFACLKLGAIYVPLNWRLTVPELTYILKDSSPKILIQEDLFAESAHALQTACQINHLLELNATGANSTFEDAIAAADPLHTFAEISHDDIWVIMYTSGTTGHPKGAMITYGMTFWNVINMLFPHKLVAGMVNLVVLPLFHTGGLNVYANPAMHMGGTNVVMRAFDPGYNLQLLQDRELGITHYLAVPTNFLLMSQHPDFESANLDSVHVCGIGGAPTPVELLKIYEKKGKALQQGFGMTETSPTVAMLTPEMAMKKLGSTGLPALHTETKIVDEEGVEITEPNKVGELWVKGPNVTPGYWNREDANQSSFTDGWLHTGDAVYKDEEGYLYIVDRWKDMYISGGENVYPAEVENVIYQLPAVGEVALIGVPDEKWGETGEAIIVVKEGHILDEGTVLKHCRENLARFKQPKTVRFVPEIPHNATGKVLKRELRN